MERPGHRYVHPTVLPIDAGFPRAESPATPDDPEDTDDDPGIVEPQPDPPVPEEMPDDPSAEPEPDADPATAGRARVGVS